MKQYLKLSIYALLTTLLFSGCFDYEDVAFNGLESVSVVDRKNGNIKIKLMVNIHNPNDYNIKVKKSTLSIYLNDKYVGETQMTEKIILKKKTEDLYPVYLNTNGKDIFKTGIGAISALLGGTADIRLKGTLKASAYGITRNFDVDETETIDINDFL